MCTGYTHTLVPEVATNGQNALQQLGRAPGRLPLALHGLERFAGALVMPVGTKKTQRQFEVPTSLLALVGPHLHLIQSCEGDSHQECN